MSNLSSSYQISNEFQYWIKDYWNKYGDPRVATLPLMSSASLPALILLSYSVFVLLIGPKFMSTRPSYSLKHPMIVYNLFMSLINLYFMIQVIILHNYGLDSFKTQFPSLTDTSTATKQIIYLHYFYMLSKFIDLLGKFAHKNTFLFLIFKFIKLQLLIPRYHILCIT